MFGGYFHWWKNYASSVCEFKENSNWFVHYVYMGVIYLNTSLSALKFGLG